MLRHFNYIPLVLLLTFGTAIASGLEIRNSIPEKFWGKWASKAENCDKSHVQNLQIGPNSLEFLKNSGIPISIVLKNQKELALIVDFTGDGNEWIGFVHFKISDDGNLLADIKNYYAGNGFARIKCK